MLFPPVVLLPINLEKLPVFAGEPFVPVYLPETASAK